MVYSRNKEGPVFLRLLSATGHKVFSPAIRYMLLSSDREAALRQS